MPATLSTIPSAFLLAVLEPELGKVEKFCSKNQKARQISAPGDLI